MLISMHVHMLTNLFVVDHIQGDELRVSISGSIGTLHEKFQAIFREVDSPKTSSSIDPQSVLQLIAVKYVCT